MSAYILPVGRRVLTARDAWYGTTNDGGYRMSEDEFTEALAQYNALVTAGVQVNAIGIGTGIDANAEVL